MNYRRKYAQNLLDQIVARGIAPWEQRAQQSVANRGASLQTDLIPGFDFTYADLASYGGEEEAEHEEALENKGKTRKGKKTWSYLRKMSEDTSWEYEDGATQHYNAETNPGAGRDFSEQRDRDNRTGVEIAWDQVGPSFYRESTMPEPSLVNQQDYNFSSPYEYKAAVYEPAGTESVTSVHIPLPEDETTRRVGGLFTENNLREQLNPEVDGLNFKQDIQKAAAAATLDHALGFGRTNRPDAVVEDEKDPLARLPGRRPQVDNVIWSDTDAVWDQHNSFQGSNRDQPIVDFAAQPGPAV